MLNVRLRAADLKMVDKATTPGEIAGVFELLKVRILESQTLKEFSKAPNITEAKFGWKDAATILQGILGDSLRYPPHPDRMWYIKLNRTIEGHGLDAEYIRTLGEYCKANLRPSYSLEFLITQHLRILAGDFNNKIGNAYGSTVMNSGRMGGKTGVTRQTDTFIEEKLC